MNLASLKQKLSSYKEKDIRISHHAEIQAETRNINLEEVKQNILNPEKLVFFEEQPARKENEKKYNCYFAYTNNYYHRYAMITNGKLLIVTIIGVRRDWQRAIRKKR